MSLRSLITRGALSFFCLGRQSRREALRSRRSSAVGAAARCVAVRTIRVTIVPVVDRARLVDVNELT
jgi:hypothetical protein